MLTALRTRLISAGSRRNILKLEEESCRAFHSGYGKQQSQTENFYGISKEAATEKVVEKVSTSFSIQQCAL